MPSRHTWTRNTLLVLRHLPRACLANLLLVLAMSGCSPAGSKGTTYSAWACTLLRGRDLLQNRVQTFWWQPRCQTMYHDTHVYRSGRRRYPKGTTGSERHKGQRGAPLFGAHIVHGLSMRTVRDQHAEPEQGLLYWHTSASTHSTALLAPRCTGCLSLSPAAPPRQALVFAHGCLCKLARRRPSPPQPATKPCKCSSRGNVLAPSSLSPLGASFVLRSIAPGSPSVRGPAIGVFRSAELGLGRLWS